MTKGKGLDLSLLEIAVFILAVVLAIGCVMLLQRIIHWVSAWPERFWSFYDRLHSERE